MNIVAAIKKLVNSDFSKPLNELVLNQRIFKADDTELCVTNNTLRSVMSGSAETISLGSFTPQLSGTVRLKFIASKNAAPKMVNIYVYENSEVVSSIYIESTSDGEESVDIPVRAFSKYSFELVCMGSQTIGYCTKAAVCGIVADNPMYSYEAV